MKIDISGKNEKEIKVAIKEVANIFPNDIAKTIKKINEQLKGELGTRPENVGWKQNPLCVKQKRPNLEMK